MNCDEVIDKLLQSTDATPSIEERAPCISQIDNTKRERLVALAIGAGPEQVKQYFGKAITADQIDAMSDKDVEKLYSRYEARLGAAMTKTLGSTILQLYAAGASMFLPIPLENQQQLVIDLESDPFVGHAVSSATCELYHKFGMYLAPITAALATFRNCQFGHICPRIIIDDDESNRSTNDRRESTGESN